MTPLIRFVGPSGAGKTFLLERIVAHLRNRGYRVAVIKHAAHGFDLDKPGKDSWRLGEAGSQVVVLASPTGVATLQKVEREPSLAELAASVADKADIILAEGFKGEAWPKIVVSRSGASPVNGRGELLALVSDCLTPRPVPHFTFEDIPGIVELILQYVAQPRLWEVAADTEAALAAPVPS